MWNIKDPYFMDREEAWKVYEQIKEKVTELAKSQRSSKVGLVRG